MSSCLNVFSTYVLLTFVLDRMVLAEGPTAADPVCWQKAGEGVNVLMNNGDVGDKPTWVANWTDSSGHGNKLQVNHWAQCPRLIKSPAESLNGHPVLGFGKTQGTRASNALVWFSGSPLYGAKGATGFIVVKAFDTSGGGQVWHFGKSKSPNEWSGSKLPVVWENFGSANRELLVNNPGIANSATARGEITPLFKSGPIMKFGEWYIYAVTIGKDRQDDVEMKGYINGILKGKQNIGLSMGWCPTAIIGDQGDGRTEMHVAEILLYDRALSDFERTRVTNYLGVKFGILEGTTLTASLPGDCNQDGAVDLSDAVCLLGFVFQNMPPALPCNSTPANVALMDCNDDGAIYISDAVYKLNFLFQGGPTPEQGTRCIEIDGCPAHPGCP